MTENDIEITVSVPRERQADFHRMFGNWLVGTDGTEPKGWRNGESWTSNDLADAVAFRRMLSLTARRILDHWATSAGEWVSGETTAAAVNVNGPRGVAGSLSSVGRTAAKLSKQLPFEYESGEIGGSGNYRMTPLVADLFRTAATEATR